MQSTSKDNSRKPKRIISARSEQLEQTVIKKKRKEAPTQTIVPAIDPPSQTNDYKFKRIEMKGKSKKDKKDKTSADDNIDDVKTSARKRQPNQKSTFHKIEIDYDPSEEDEYMSNSVSAVGNSTKMQEFLAILGKSTLKL